MTAADTTQEDAARDDDGHGGAHRLSRPRDWAWRRRIRANRQTYQVYRAIVATIGFVVVAGGLVAVPFPGPGWLIVFIGVSIWASEFHWARRLHEYGMRKLREWNRWVMSRHLAVRGGIALLTCLFVNTIVWVTLKMSGVPSWVPDPAEAFLHTHLAL
ncbi:TIGR02611 family protein [Mobilicoccus pelagius]|uniref:TIGR02611 family protein n=1 Tax=Mobilicoccus pelagius NBRC 104925 TaxID=1089455 RepID=H5UUI8_9MICO|nr:TIGR02611 family protein [Mobilicoccus pelagius]GAB49396.1 hypothetical protein MOPEL_130_00030 [Mobilicoccus pelagius NBRC 104925]